MIEGFLILIAAQLLGGALETWAHLPLPGPVIGLFLLAIFLMRRPQVAAGGLGMVAQGLLRHMSLLFVPAGVGMIDHLDLIASQGVPLLLALAGSTLLALVVAGAVLQGAGKVPLRSRRHGLEPPHAE